MDREAREMDGDLGGSDADSTAPGSPSKDSATKLLRPRAPYSTRSIIYTARPVRTIRSCRYRGRECRSCWGR